jgi:UDP:flavonoid glycosyltransferase YjiC (YdhE family)
LASYKFKVQRVTLGTGFFAPPDISPLPEIRYWMASNPADLFQDEVNVLHRVNALLNSENLQPLGRLSQMYVDVDGNFLLTFPELDHYPQRAEGKYFGMWSLPHEIRPAWPEGDGPRVFAYLKQLPSSTQMTALLAAIREVNVPSLVYIPDGNAAWLRRFESSRLRFTSVPLDMHEVGRGCDLAILNGNAGTATELLLRGVPQLHLPLYLEQEVFSRRVVDLGAGRLAAPNRPELFAVQLATMIHQLDHYRERAQQFAARYAQFDAAASVSEIVTRIADRPACHDGDLGPHQRP